MLVIVNELFASSVTSFPLTVTIPIVWQLSGATKKVKFPPSSTVCVPDGETVPPSASAVTIIAICSGGISAKVAEMM